MLGGSSGALIGLIKRSPRCVEGVHLEGRDESGTQAGGDLQEFSSALSFYLSLGVTHRIVVTGKERVMLGTATGVCGVDRGRSVALLGFELCLLLLMRGGGDFGFWCTVGWNRPGLATLSF